jgi:hypothetical protein
MGDREDFFADERGGFGVVLLVAVLLTAQFMVGFAVGFWAAS